MPLSKGGGDHEFHFADDEKAGKGIASLRGNCAEEEIDVAKHAIWGIVFPGDDYVTGVGVGVEDGSR